MERLIAPKRCPVCFKIGTYDPMESNAPGGWYHIEIYGVSEYTCSQACRDQVIKVAKRRFDKAEATRGQPLLPPDVVL